LSIYKIAKFVANLHFFVTRLTPYFRSSSRFVYGNVFDSPATRINYTIRRRHRRYILITWKIVEYNRVFILV